MGKALWALNRFFGACGVVKKKVHALGCLFVPGNHACALLTRGPATICMNHHFSHFSKSMSSPRGVQHLSQGVGGSLPASHGCTLGQTPVQSNTGAITPGRSLASCWLGTSSNTDDALTRPEQRLWVYPWEMERCTCPVGTEECASWDTFSAPQSPEAQLSQALQASEAGCSAPSHPSRHHSCLMARLGKLQTFSRLSKDTHVKEWILNI